MIDKAARQLNIDRVEIRNINAPDSNGKIGKDQGPVTSAFLKEALDKAATMFATGRSARSAPARRTATR